MSKKILIIGGDGYLGWLAMHLSEGVKVSVLGQHLCKLKMKREFHHCGVCLLLHERVNTWKKIT